MYCIIIIQFRLLYHHYSIQIIVSSFNSDFTYKQVIIYIYKKNKTKKNKICMLVLWRGVFLTKQPPEYKHILLDRYLVSEGINPSDCDFDLENSKLNILSAKCFS